MSLEEAPSVPSQSPAASFPFASTLRKPDGDQLADVFRITKEIFGFEPTTEVMCDPENPEWTWTVVNVKSRGEPKELVQRQIQWHTLVGELKLADHPRLSIMPVK
jgi:hypothetical protein